METLNKIFITYYKNEISNTSTSFIHYSLKEAIDCGINQFAEAFYEKYEREPINNELENFIQSELTESTFIISVVSGNRLRFNTSKELINYFLDHVDRVDNENLYDFLLSLVESHELFFDYNGECISSDVTSQCPSEEWVWEAHIEFTEDSCKEGKYIFSYNHIGIDTLYNTSWIINPNKL